MSIIWADGFSFHGHNSIPDDPRYISTVGKFYLYDTFNGLDTPTGRTKWARPIDYGASGLKGVLAYINGHKGTRAHINELISPFNISNLMTSEAQAYDSSNYNNYSKYWRLANVTSMHIQFYCIPAVTAGEILRLYDRSGNLKLTMKVSGVHEFRFIDESGIEYASPAHEDMTSSINYFKILFDGASNTIKVTRNEGFSSFLIPFDSSDIEYYAYLQLSNAAFTSFVIKEAEPNMIRMNVDAFYPPSNNAPTYSAYKVDKNNSITTYRRNLGGQRYSYTNILVQSANFGFGDHENSGIIDGYGNIVFYEAAVATPIRIAEGDFTYAASSKYFNHISVIALDSSGRVHTWSTEGLTDSGPSGSGYISVESASEGSLFAIDSSGYIHAWGRNDHNLITDTPTGSGYKKIVSAGRHSVVALHSNGTLTSWGEYSPPALGSLPSDIDDVFPAYDKNFVVAIDSSGTLWQAHDSNTYSNSDHTCIHACGPKDSRIYGITSSGELVSYARDLSSSTVLGTGYHAVYGYGNKVLALKDEITSQVNLVGNIYDGITHTGEFSGSLDGSGLVTSRTEDRYLTTGLENNGVKPSDIYDSVLDSSAIIRANSTNSWSVCPAMTWPGRTDFPYYLERRGDSNIDRTENSAVGNTPANVVFSFGSPSITDIDRLTLLANVGTSVNDMQLIMGFNTPNKLTALTGRVTFDPDLSPIWQNMPDYPDCLGRSGNASYYDSENDWPRIENQSGDLVLQDVSDIPPGATGASCKLSEAGNYNNHLYTEYRTDWYLATKVLSFWLKVNSFTTIGGYHMIYQSFGWDTGFYIDNTGAVFFGYFGTKYPQNVQINDNSWNYFGLLIAEDYAYARVNNELISNTASLPGHSDRMSYLRFYGSDSMDVWVDEIRVDASFNNNIEAFYNVNEDKKPDGYNTPTVDTFCNEIADYTNISTKTGIRMLEYLYNNPMG